MQVLGRWNAHQVASVIREHSESVQQRISVADVDESQGCEQPASKIARL